MSDVAQNSPRLQREVGLFALFMVSLGSVIGSGWLLGTLNASIVAGPAAIISWIIGAILLIGIALVYAELGAAYPISGGTARFTWIHAGTLGGFFCGTYSYLQAVAIAPIEVEAIARVPEREGDTRPAELLVAADRLKDWCSRWH